MSSAAPDLAPAVIFDPQVIVAPPGLSLDDGYSLRLPPDTQSTPQQAGWSLRSESWYLISEITFDYAPSGAAGDRAIEIAIVFPGNPFAYDVRQLQAIAPLQQTTFHFATYLSAASAAPQQQMIPLAPMLLPSKTGVTAFASNPDAGDFLLNAAIYARAFPDYGAGNGWTPAGPPGSNARRTGISVPVAVPQLT